MATSNELALNRKALHDYEIVESYEVGIVLQGTEIKSLRQHGGNLQEAYAVVQGGELWLYQMSIAHYAFGNLHNHEEKRKRKLLAHHREIDALKAQSQEKGLTLVPLALYLKGGVAKLRLAVAKGKKSFDKRASIKERDEKRAMQQALKR
jgi:SsrA-binding protein